ncbi:ribosome maturation factor RimM [Desulfovibrio ferrophilus]|uniref:Ribosome maturation factor RimM n=1 Tax=Desulfovibrio ferrophilus TaxID=241368 RepID=A0A2Z6B039_9BACT|nr:ribosome maturation factor RimM [Desulfovibrio ferrophilus]
MDYHGDSPFLLDEFPEIFLRPKAPRPRPTVGAKSGKPGLKKRVAKPAAPRTRPVKIESWRPHKGRLLVFFEGIADRDAADELRGAELLVREADLPEPGEDELYLYEVEGLTVLLEDGSTLGHVRQVQLLPAGQEVWAIDTEDGREVLFPVADEFVAGVDLDEGWVTIVPPPGLLELYLNDDSSE